MSGGAVGTSDRIRVLRNQGFILFIRNLSEQIHWQGLGQVFDRHRQVLDVFIPAKRLRSGERFGFVRMRTRTEAQRVRDRLDGGWIYGAKMSVMFAQADTQRSRDIKDSTKSEIKGGTLANSGGVKLIVGKRSSINVSTSSSQRLDRERQGRGIIQSRVINGEVDIDKWNTLQHCAVGWSKQQKGLASIAKELHYEGIRDMTIMRLAGSRILLLFQNKEIRKSLVQSGILLKWFSRVQNWVPEIERGSRRAWISIRGIPIHAWSKVSFQRVGELWGQIIKYEASITDPHSCERGELLIETEQLEWIEEYIDFKVGKESYKVRIVEFEPMNEESTCPCCKEMSESSEIGESDADKKELEQREGLTRDNEYCDHDDQGNGNNKGGKVVDPICDQDKRHGTAGTHGSDSIGAQHSTSRGWISDADVGVVNREADCVGEKEMHNTNACLFNCPIQDVTGGEWGNMHWVEVEVVADGGNFQDLKTQEIAFERESKTKGDIDGKLLSGKSKPIRYNLIPNQIAEQTVGSEALQEAQATVNLCKLLGASTIGNEEGVVRDIAEALNRQALGL
ncbi:hypothetical protein HRI_002854000 [Hibiscus trionum]|uniref:RRM domain-containing protein n=1 Tax=Hibiscus trionum TaxID=183268 RepID=A0A9W7M6I4_HIBTR|nr:hypothetical protein HRI_002854000 [Hibiscus trionum]